MKQLEKYKVILWDFDGVIMDSMPIRSKGFEEVLKTYPREQVNELIAFHDQNGGLSRYLKFRYFFEKIRKEKVTETQIQELAMSFSKIMISMLINKELFINKSVSFIKRNFRNYTFHIVSGSDGAELNYICKSLNIDHFFSSIQGSPTPKIELVNALLTHFEYNNSQVCLIGDSINDLEAAQINGIDFWGFNNNNLKSICQNYIETFD